MGLFGSGLTQEQELQIKDVEKKIITEPNNMELYIEKAMLQADFNKLKDAKKTLEYALEQEPKNFEILASMSLILTLDEKFKKGLEYAEKLLEIHKPDKKMLENLANDSRFVKCLDLVLFWWDKAMALDPSDTDMILYRAYLFILYGKYKEALKILDDYLKKYKENPAVLNLKGEAMKHRGKNKQAKQLFTNVLELDSENKFALNGLGFALTDLGKHKEAIEYHQKVLDDNPKHPMALNGMGYALMHHKEFLKGYTKQTESLAYLENSLDSYPQQSEAWLYLAKLYDFPGGKLRDENKALECWQNAIPYDLTDFAYEQIKIKLGLRKRDKAKRITTGMFKLGLGITLLGLSLAMSSGSSSGKGYKTYTYYETLPGYEYPDSDSGNSWWGWKNPYANP